MKRIQTACLDQTIHFQLKDDISHDEGVNLVKEEYANYKATMDRNHTKYKVVDEKIEDNGSITIKIKKQYNSYDIGNYLD